MKKSFALLTVLSSLSLTLCFSQIAQAKNTCYPSEDTKLLLGEGGSIPSDYASFYYSASRLPRIAMCADSGELKGFYCVEWEGSVFSKSAKEVTQGAKIVFDVKSGLVIDFIASTNEKGFKYLVDDKLVLIEGKLKENIIELINAQLIQTKALLPQMTLIDSLNRPNKKNSIENVVKVIGSLIKESTGSLHLNCIKNSKVHSNVSRVLEI